MNVLEKRNSEVRTNTPQDNINMLATLLRKNCISYRMLLNHLVEIVKTDEKLVVKAVLVITDRGRADSAGISEIDYQDALVAVRCAEKLRTKPVLVAALSDAMKAQW